MRLTQVIAMLAIALATTVAEGQDGWMEDGDAPAGIPDHQETIGVNALRSISGSLDGIVDHVDTYAIVVTDPASFRIDTEPELLNAEVARARLRMWMWADPTFGRGTSLLMANDDSPETDCPATEFCTLLTDPLEWPGELVNAPGSVVNGGRYLLSVSYDNNNPLDAMLTPLADFPANPLGLHGPVTSAGPFTSWEDGGPVDPGADLSYTLQLFGVGFSESSQLASDFDGDGLVDCNDVDALVMEIAAGGQGAAFDLNGDGLVDQFDLTEWLAQAGAANLGPGLSYLQGDANLDGLVDISDFNRWNDDKFHNVARWCAGDFNANGSVDISDFNIWNANKFQSSSPLASVPEPNLSWMTIVLFTGILILRRNQRSES